MNKEKRGEGVSLNMTSDQFAEHLHSIGWKSPCDAQWTNLAVLWSELTSSAAPAPVLSDLTDEQIMKMFSDVCAIGNWPRAATKRNLITFARTLLAARSQA